MKNKTIALVSNSTWNIYNFRLNVIDKLIEEDFKVIVIAPVDEYLKYKEHYPQIEHFGIRTLKRDSTNPFRDFLLLLELIRRYKIIKPDLIIHYTNKPNIYGAFAARFNKIKSIGIITGLGYPFLRKGWITFVTSMLYKLSAKYHSKLIFENIEDRELFEKNMFIGSSKGISIKGCGVNTDYYAPRPKSGEGNKVVFTFIGRLLYDKGIKEFVRAASRISEKYNNVEFWVAGELDPQNPATVLKEDLTKWVNDKTIKYLGFKRDIRETIAASDCIVLPSYREAIPRTITEGMAMAKPVITTDTAGCREAVEEGLNGFLVKVKDVDSLVAAFENFIGLPEEKKEEMGQYSLQKARREFDDKLIAQEIYDISISVLNA